MDKISSKLKRLVVEPKVFSMLIRSKNGQVLYIGVHFSLEEAYGVALSQMANLPNYKNGDGADIELWSSIPARQMIAQFIDPSKINDVIDFLETPETSIIENNLAISGRPTEDGTKEETIEEKVKELKEIKSSLMKKLIEDGDINQAEKLKSIIGINSHQYVVKKIKKNIDSISIINPPKNSGNNI